MSSSSSFPLDIQELRGGNVYRIDVKWFSSIKDIKDQLHKEINYPPSRMQIYHSSRTKHIKNQTTLHDLGIIQAGSILRLALMFSANPQYTLLPSKDISLDVECQDMLRQVRAGLRCGYAPSKTDMLDCTGGVYFMKGQSNKAYAVFKPSDEEQGMPNNPKGHAGNGDHGLRSFLKPGEGYIRETAAYILDRDNFCGVPATTIVHCEHDAFHYPLLQKQNQQQTGAGGAGDPFLRTASCGSNSSGTVNNMYPKLGSLQQFIPSGDTFEDISPSLVGVLELQRIALLDMRLLNGDRNASNLLAIRKPPGQVGSSSHSNRRSSSVGTQASTGSTSNGSAFDGEEMDLGDFLDMGSSTPLGAAARNSSNNSRYSDQYELVPIDHGYCCPTHLAVDELDWAWFHCPHVAVEVQPEIKAYINALDVEALLAELTRQIPMREDQLFLLRLTHALLKEGINAGLTLRELAGMIARTQEGEPSPLEKAIAAAEDNAQRAIELKSGRAVGAGGGGASPSFRKNFAQFARAQIKLETIADSSTVGGDSNGNSVESSLQNTPVRPDPPLMQQPTQQQQQQLRLQLGGLDVDAESGDEGGGIAVQREMEEEEEDVRPFPSNIPRWSPLPNATTSSASSAASAHGNSPNNDNDNNNSGSPGTECSSQSRHQGYLRQGKGYLQSADVSRTGSRADSGTDLEHLLLESPTLPLPLAGGAGAGTGEGKEEGELGGGCSPVLGYLSSENILKLQRSPTVCASAASATANAFPSSSSSFSFSSSMVPLRTPASGSLSTGTDGHHQQQRSLSHQSLLKGSLTGSQGASSGSLSTAGDASASASRASGGSGAGYFIEDLGSGSGSGSASASGDGQTLPPTVPAPAQRHQGQNQALNQGWAAAAGGSSSSSRQHRSSSALVDLVRQKDKESKSQGQNQGDSHAENNQQTGSGSGLASKLSVSKSKSMTGLDHCEGERGGGEDAEPECEPEGDTYAGTAVSLGFNLRSSRMDGNSHFSKSSSNNSRRLGSAHARSSNSAEPVRGSAGAPLVTMQSFDTLSSSSSSSMSRAAHRPSSSAAASASSSAARKQPQQQPAGISTYDGFSSDAGTSTAASSYESTWSQSRAQARSSADGEGQDQRQGEGQGEGQGLQLRTTSSTTEDGEDESGTETETETETEADADALAGASAGVEESPRSTMQVFTPNTSFRSAANSKHSSTTSTSTTAASIASPASPAASFNRTLQLPLAKALSLSTEDCADNATTATTMPTAVGAGGAGGASSPSSPPLSPLSPPGPPLGLARVASFAAFESPPLYDYDLPLPAADPHNHSNAGSSTNSNSNKHEGSHEHNHNHNHKALPAAGERRLARLKKERRRAVARTREFQELRLSFAAEAARSMVLRCARQQNLHLHSHSSSPLPLTQQTGGSSKSSTPLRSENFDLNHNPTAAASTSSATACV